MIANDETIPTIHQRPLTRMFSTNGQCAAFNNLQNVHQIDSHKGSQHKINLNQLKKKIPITTNNNKIQQNTIKQTSIYILKTTSENSLHLRNI